MSETNNTPKWARDPISNLVGSVEYVYDEFGAIDWRSTIPQKYKYPNKTWFFLNGQDLPETSENLTDDQTVISLKGLKWAAKVRGFSSVMTDIDFISEDHIVCKCEITWTKNSEDPEPIIYTEYANATKDNTDAFCSKFLETVAANRAFCRCVRNFLNINSVSEEEMDPNIEKEQVLPEVKSTKPQDVLANLAAEKGYETFADLQAGFTELGFFHDKMEKWVEYKNIPAKSARELLAKLKATGNSSV